MKQEVMRMARRAARRYARRCWWADEEDLVQEATTAALHATRPDGPFDPECGVPVGAYVWRTCILHLRAYLWRQSSPVSETGHKLATLHGVHHTELTETSATTDIDAFVLLSEKEWTEKVRAQLDYLFDKDVKGKLVARVLLDEEKPEYVAHEAGVPVQDLYRLTKKAKRSIADNAFLFHLMRNR